MNRGKRIALYGGTFDPVHLGHVEVAKRVSELFEIDELIFVPAQVAPHKVGREVTQALHRYAMLALATQHEPCLLLSTIELDAPAGRYTIETLAHFKAAWSEAELFFIMGADSWSEITGWREWERLLTMANHIVVSRPGYQLALDNLPGSLAARVVDLRGMDRPTAAKVVLGSAGYHIFFTDVVMMDVSATSIRNALRQPRTDLASMVPSVVADYINKYGLYRD
jgi:nicotinate-nucleotide adenylyltransferase